jgi:predicted DCC family thiol-disulfide oxidoreductase YuxK
MKNRSNGHTLIAPFQQESRAIKSLPGNVPLDKPILLFDGECNLCNGAVRFIIRNDPQARIRYASLQSETGSYLLDICDAKTKDSLPDTVVLIHEGKCYIKSTAALRTLQLLGGVYAWFSRLLSWIPRSFRDWVYDWVSRNRKQWFGKGDICPLPSPEDSRRFLPGG